MKYLSMAAFALMFAACTNDLPDNPVVIPEEPEEQGPTQKEKDMVPTEMIWQLDSILVIYNPGTPIETCRMPARTRTNGRTTSTPMTTSSPTTSSSTVHSMARLIRCRRCTTTTSVNTSLLWAARSSRLAMCGITRMISSRSADCSRADG